MGQYEDLTERLANNRGQLADLEAAAHRLKVETWMGYDSKYISERDRAADFNALDLTCDIITLRGEIAADEDRRTYIRDALTWIAD